MAANRDIVVRLRAEISNFRSALAEASAAAKRTQKDTEGLGKSTDKAMNQLVSSASKHRDAWNTAGSSMLGFGAAAVAGVGVAIKSYAEFDKQMSSVQAASMASASEMTALREAAITAGADTSFSAKEAAQGIEELAKAGVSTKDVLNGGLTGALSLAAAGSLEVGAAAELAATALTQFKLQGKDIPHVADLLAAGAGKAQGSVEDIGGALKQSGLVASQFGISVEETVGSLAAFASAGLIGSDAGTSLKSALLKLAAPSKEAAGLMQELGINAYDASGQFVGMQDLAGQLQDKMSGLTQAQRDSAMATIFGTDAIRVANVLYNEGAAGIAEWTDKVNASGFAAEQARLKQNNLAGDIEKLGGSLDSVFLKSASGANAVLRGMVQGAEDLIDAIGKVPAPVLQTGLAIAGLAGGAALLGGAFLKVFPAVMETRQAFAALAADSPKLSGALKTVGKGAGIAAAALAGLSILGAMFNHKAITSAEDYGQAILKVAQAGKAANSGDFDSLFKKFDDQFGSGTAIAGVNGMADAVKRLSDQNFGDSINKFLSPVTEMVGLSGGAVRELENRFKGLGDAMGGLVQNGGAEAAAANFKTLSDEFERNGKSAQDALDVLPGYKDALLAQATAAEVVLTPTELLDLAMGKIPASMQAAAGATATYTDATGQAVPITEDMAKQLEELGISADGAVTSLASYVEQLYAAGLLTMSERDSQRAYADALDAVGLAADGTGGKLGTLGTAFDNTTEQGRKNQAAFDDVAKAGIDVMTAMSKTTDAFGNNVYSQEQLQTQLGTTYQNLIASAGQFGITGQAAEDLARKVLGIPPGVSIESWMSDYAKRMAEQTKGAMDAINGKTVNTYVVHHETTIRTTDDRGVILDRGSGVDRRSAGFQTGGEVNYLASGGTPIRYAMVPRGTDTVPAMLTPGEFVVNRKATSENLALLRGINSGAVRSNQFAGAAGSTLAGSSTVYENHWHIDAKPGLSSMYAQEIVDRGINRAKDINAAYGINRIR